MYKRFTIVSLPVCLTVVLLSFSTHDIPDNTRTALDANMISCSPPPGQAPDTTSNGKYIVSLPGWGNHNHSISTSNDSAQYYFNQGLSLYYSYHPKEARASFLEASRFDSTCTMAYWGEALTLGPGYNFNHLYKLSPDIYGVLEKMNKANPNIPEREKRMAAVMNLRYSADPADEQRKKLNEDYAQGLRGLLKDFPEDPDIVALYIDAVMLIHPWDFWNNDGSPKPWTPELVSLCESTMKKNPDHPAFLHYYIHLTEASAHPEVALAGATILKQNMPGVAHMVHMASHEYERNGLFEKGVTANDEANLALRNYDSLASNLSLNTSSSHYLGVRAYCALSGGISTASMPHAMECRAAVKPSHEDTYFQYLYMFPELTQVRMGRWQNILDNSKPPEQDWAYAQVLYHFARGMAFAGLHQLDSAKKSLSALKSFLSDPTLTVINIPFNNTIDCAMIAEKILSGSLAFAEGKVKNGIGFFEAAAGIEDKLIYREPADWMLPARQYLGAWLLKTKKNVAAEKVYRDDLLRNIGNGWSLLGLSQSLKAQGKGSEAQKFANSSATSFSGAAELPPASAYIID